MEETQYFPKQEKFLLPIALLCAATLYWTVLPKLVHDWLDDPNFSHGFLVPFFSAWLVWERRSKLRAFASTGDFLPGIFLVMIGVAMLVVGKAGGEYFTMRSSLVFVVWGLFWIVFGGEGFWICLFPLAFLFFMVPIPYILYDAIAFPLKMLSAWIAEHSLNAIGIPVFREGNIIFLPNLQLEVADACSGIRSLISLMALAAVVAYLFRIGIIPGIVLLLCSVPITVGTNSLRIIITGIISNYYGSEYASGFLHEFYGLGIFIMNALLILWIGTKLRIVRRSSLSD